MFDPAKFYQSFFDETVIKQRMAQLTQYGMEEILSKRGWYGYELPDCSWEDHWKPSIAVSNYRCWPAEARGWIVQVLDESGNHTCILRRKAVHEMPQDEWDELMKSVKKLKEDYPLLDESDHREVETEGQDEAWREDYREEFQKLLAEKFDGVFATMHHGDRIEDKFSQMVTDPKLTDAFFYDYMRYRWQGDEWTEDQSGDWSIDVSDIVNGIDTSDIVNYVYPEDPRQLKFKFTFTRQAEAIVRKMLDDDQMVMLESPLAHRIVDILMEDQGPHKYSCVMINLPEELSNEIMAWGKLQVRDEDVFVDEKGGMGREDKPHVTVLYGLFDDKPSDVLLQVFEHTAPFDIKLGAVKIFRNDTYDVVVLEVTSPFLHALNRNIRSVVAYENDYPDYKPHVTIAYVKPGTCDRLEGVTPWDDPVKMGVTKLGQEGHFTAKAVIFSSKSGEKTEHDLGTSDKLAKAVKEAFDPDNSRVYNLFDVAHGRPPGNAGELREWLNQMLREYEAETGQPVMGRLSFNIAFVNWIENKVSVQAAMQNWEASAFESMTGRKPETDGELQKWIREASQAHYQETGKIKGLREWLEEKVTEASDEEMAAFVAGSGALNTPSHVSHRTIRRIIGRHIVDKVEISRNDAGGPRGWREGHIQITYKDNGRQDSPSKVWSDEWASYEVLKWALRNWRNLYGAPLFVAGQPAGEVGYRNPALAE